MLREIGKEFLLLANKNYYDNYNNTCFKNKKRDFVQKETSFINGINTIGATLKIIRNFIDEDSLKSEPQY
jgi:hypothetical protein